MRHVSPKLLRIAACAFLVLPASSCDRSARQSQSESESLARALPAPPPATLPAREQPAEVRSSHDEIELPATAAADSEPIYNVGGEVVKPKKISGRNPDLRSLMRAHRHQGVAIFQAIITKEGRVRDVRILKVGDPELVQPMREALETWRFKPATLHGEPVAVYYNLTLHIRLQ